MQNGKGVEDINNANEGRTQESRSDEALTAR